MLEMNWVPLVGATVVSKKVWDTIPPADQQIMLAAAERAGKEIRTQARKEMIESVGAMKKRGLMVHALTPAAEAAWRRLAESTYPKIRGAIVPAQLFDEVQKLLAEYRAKK
jgi:TRAP-type C4-dicarboxylate transport system substrate-binding protein